MRTSLAIWASLTILGTSAAAGEPAFSAKPAVTRAGDKVTTSFAVAAPTDVEVAVLAADGRVVRHLAAGVLGGRTPPPEPLKAGLAQALEWDGKDDAGKPASGGPFKVRVRLGLKPSFSHVFAGDPAKHMRVGAMACGPGGELYVQSGNWAPSSHYVLMDVKAYDAGGAFLRQVAPYPATLPPEKRPAVKWLEMPDGPAVPLVYHSSAKCLYPEMGNGGRNMLVRPDGKLVLTGGSFRDAPHPAAQRALVLGPGGEPGDDYLGPNLASAGLGGMFLIALSPDGKSLYVSGLREKKGKPVPAVLRTSWDRQEAPEVFLDGAKGADGPAEPRGVATDAAGNVYVCDHAGGRVLVVSPAGQPVGKLPAKDADLVAVHPRSGAVYVLCTRSDPARNASPDGWGSGANFTDKTLLKFESLKSSAPAASLQLSAKSPACPVMALDGASPTPALWIANIKWGDGAIRKIVDKGAAFEDAGCPIREKFAKDTVDHEYLDICAAPATDEVCAGGGDGKSGGLLRFDGLTGKCTGRAGLPRMERGDLGQPEYSWDGRSILYLPPMTELFRLTLDGKPENWPGGAGHAASGFPQGFIRPRGHGPAPDGGAVVLHHPEFREFTRGAVSRVGPDGKVTAKDLISIDAPVGGVRCDPQGNIYVGAFVKPKGQMVPEQFAGKLPGTAKDGPLWFYTHLYGSVLKFGPSGGKVVAGDGEFIAAAGARFKPAKAEGLLWSHYGLSPMPSRATGCSCQTARFDVDRFGRVFVPDAMRFAVQVLDGSGQPLARFGEYGNVDSRRPGNGIQKPDIPLAWPHAVAVTDRMVYVADMVNHRIVAVRLDAAVEETCEAK